MNIDMFIENNKDLNIKKISRIEDPIIYFICRKTNNEIIYIGKTKNFYNRISSHFRVPEFNNCFICYFICSKDEYSKKEKLLIKSVKPKYNIIYLQANNKKNKSENSVQLNTDKIKSEMDRMGVKKLWLAAKLKNTPAMVTYIFKHKPITFANKLARILNLDPKDLIR